MKSLYRTFDPRFSKFIDFRPFNVLNNPFFADFILAIKHVYTFLIILGQVVIVLF